MVDNFVTSRFFLYFIISFIAIAFTIFLFVWPHKPTDYAKNNPNYSEDYE